MVLILFTVVNRRRRDIPKDVYNELATVQKVKSFHTFVVFVAMDPNKGFIALPGNNMCALLKGTDIRCVNADDCKLMAEVGIDCPYKFGGGGNGGTGTGTGSGSGASKGKSTGKKDDSSGPQPWIYGVSSVLVIAIVVIVLAIFVLRRRRTKRKVRYYRISFSKAGRNAKKKVCLGAFVCSMKSLRLQQVDVCSNLARQMNE